MGVGGTYGYRSGYQPIRTPSYTPQSYGVAGKWSAEAVKSRSTGTATAADLFMGPSQSGPDWAAAFLTAGSTDSAFQDYVKRNHEKFNGPVLEAMLTQADLVDWYKEEQQKKIAELTNNLAESAEGADLGSLTSQVNAAAAGSTAGGTDDAEGAGDEASGSSDTAPGQTVDVTV